MNDPWQHDDDDLTPQNEEVQSRFIRGCLGNDYPLLSRLLSDPETVKLIQIDQPDESGSPALLIASCFGYAEIVSLLLDAGAAVDAHDARGWSALMWASNNNHTGIAKTLIEHGANRDAVTKLGRSASDFATDHTLKESLSGEEYQIGIAGTGDEAAIFGGSSMVSGDFYGASSGLDFEESLREQEQARRMALEAGMNLEVDLGALSIDPNGGLEDDVLEGPEDGQGFVWDHCLPSQMFVFSEESIPSIVRLAITEYPPQRNPSQKPVPANLLFLASRFAQYYSTPKILENLLEQSLRAIESTVQTRHDDMTILSFWISNCLLLQYYLRKDPGLELSTTSVQLRLSEMINEIYGLLVSDAERRIDKVLNESILDYSAIAGLSELEMSDEWRLFKRKQVTNDGTLSPRRRRGASPRNITSLLSSTLYVLEAYTIHPIIIIQAISQIVYWMSMELFNRVMQGRKYLSRGKAMDLRMNTSQIEEWVRNNNRSWQSLPDLATRCVKGMKRFVALLQLLQCLSSLKEDEVRPVVDSIEGITARQALHVAEHYRSERTETKIPRSTKIALAALEREQSATIPPDGEGILLNVADQLSFSLPTTTDLILSYGAGIGGAQRENEKLFTPTLPLDLIDKLDAIVPGGSGKISAIDKAKGYTAGMGTLSGDPNDGEEAESNAEEDYEVRQQRAEAEEKLASLVGSGLGVW